MKPIIAAPLKTKPILFSCCSSRSAFVSCGRASILPGGFVRPFGLLWSGYFRGGLFRIVFFRGGHFDFVGRSVGGYCGMCFVFVRFGAGIQPVWCFKREYFAIFVARVFFHLRNDFARPTNVALSAGIESGLAVLQWPACDLDCARLLFCSNFQPKVLWKKYMRYWLRPRHCSRRPAPQ